MSRMSFACLAIGLLVTGCGRSSSTSTSSNSPEGVAYGDYVIGEPLHYQNLTIVPIASSTPRTDDRFITLDEGLTAGTIEVRERGGEQPGTSPANSAPNAPAEGTPTPNSEDRSPQRQDTAGQNAVTEPAQGQASAVDGASVNEVVVVNRSEKPLYLMPGDLMIGGQQDRVIGQEIVVEPFGKPMTIPVFCVEHGRWSERDVAQNVKYLENLQAKDATPLPREELTKLAQAANDGQFVRSAGVVTKDVRVAVQAGGQQVGVWDEVAKANGRNGARSESGAFTVNFGEKELAERLDPFIAAFQTRVAESPNVVGVIVAVNGKPHSVDVFESTPLFQKLWPKLLKSFALDALGSSPEVLAQATLEEISVQLDLEGDEIRRLHSEASAALRGTPTEDFNVTAAVACLKETCEAQVVKTDKTAGVALMRRQSNQVTAFVISVIPVEEASGEASGGGSAGGFGGGGGMGGSVHTGGFF